MAASQSDPVLPTALDHPNKKFTTIYVYPTGENSAGIIPKRTWQKYYYDIAFCCFSDAGEDNHPHGVVHFGFPVARPDGHMLFEAQGEISKGSRPPEKFGVSEPRVVF